MISKSGGQSASSSSGNSSGGGNGRNIVIPRAVSKRVRGARSARRMTGQKRVRRATQQIIRSGITKMVQFVLPRLPRFLL